MDSTGKLLLRLIDPYGDPLKEKLDIDMRNQEITDNRRFGGLDASTNLLLTGLSGPPRNLYLMEINAPSYLPVRRFVTTSGEEPREPRVVPLAINPRKVSAVVFPDFRDLPPAAQALLERSGGVEGQAGVTGNALYERLDTIRRAGMLNIFAKCNRTRLSNGRTVLSYFQEEVSQLLEARGDRFFAQVPKELREETKNSVAEEIFEPASSALHTPPKGFSDAGSFKTVDRYGNLQLTFFAKGDTWRADIDIDDANGLEHVFQVLRNTLSGRPTHPYDIHQILLIHQELDSGYRLKTQAA